MLGREDASSKLRALHRSRHRLVARLGGAGAQLHQLGVRRVALLARARLRLAELRERRVALVVGPAVRARLLLGVPREEEHGERGPRDRGERRLGGLAHVVQGRGCARRRRAAHACRGA